MACKCPVCKKETKHVGTLYLHILNVHDKIHESWLNSYCASNNINLMKILVDRAKNTKGANEPLIEALRRDFCTLRTLCQEHRA